MNILSFFFRFMLFFNFLRKRKNEPCLKIIFTNMAFIVGILYRLSKPQNRLKSCFTFRFFTSYFQSELRNFAISKFRFENDNLLYHLLLLLWGNSSLNPGLFSKPQLIKQEDWIHLIHLNINSLLPNIDELRDKAKKIKAAVISIFEFKLYCTVLEPEIYTENYKILCFDRNRYGGGVACQIRSDMSYKLNPFLPN